MIVEFYFVFFDKVGKIFNIFWKVVSELENNEFLYSGFYGNDVEIVIDGVGDGGIDDNELDISFLGYYGSIYLYWEIVLYVMIWVNGLSWVRVMLRILLLIEKCYW